MQNKTTQIPFEENDGIFLIPASSGSSQQSKTATQKHFLQLPSSFQHEEDGLVLIGEDNNKEKFFARELDLKRLNEIHQHLWMTSLTGPARSLHHQAVIGREIVLTEQADLHLTWRGGRIYVKPLPEFLLCYGIWDTVIEKNDDMRRNAKGFLLSYLWLVRHRSDWKIAREKDLFPEELSWEEWTRISALLIKNLDHHQLDDINPRYQHGELRLDRLDLIYRFCSRRWGWTNFIRGYKYEYHDYLTFLSTHLAWILGSFLYITVVLTAMQVGLGTNALKDNAAFQNASYGFTVFSIISPILGLSAVGLMAFTVFIFNYIFQQKKRKASRNRNKKLLEAAGMKEYIH